MVPPQVWDEVSVFVCGGGEGGGGRGEGVCAVRDNEHAVLCGTEGPRPSVIVLLSPWQRFLSTTCQ